MQAFGMLLLAAATAGDGFGYAEPGVGLKKWLRPHVVVSDRRPPGGPPYTAATMGGALAARASERPPVRQYQEPDLLPRPRRHADRLAKRRRPQRRTDLPVRPTCRAGSLQLQSGLYLPPEDRKHPGPPRRQPLPDDRGRPDHAGDRRLPGPQRHPRPVHGRGLRPGGRRRQLRDQGHLLCPIRSTRNWPSRASRLWSRPGSSRASTRFSRPTSEARSS